MRKPKLHFGLRTRITLVISGILLLTFSVIAYFLVHNVFLTDIKNLNQSSTAFASLATPKIGNTYGIYSDSGSIYIDKEIQNFTNLDSNIDNVYVIDLSGNTIFSQNNSPAFQSVNQTNDFSTIYTKNSNGLITQILVPYIDDNGQHPYAVAYEISDQTVNHDIEHQIIDIIVFSLLGLLVSAAAMYEFTSRFFVSPIESVSKQALIISQGMYEQTIDVKRKDEIGDLAISVNKMSDSLKQDIAKLEEVDQLKNEFISITSHNLRTPLTIIKGNIQLLGVVTKLSTAAEQMLKKISDSATRLGNFSEDMLTIASIEANNTEIKPERTTIAELTANLKDLFTTTASQKKLTLDWEVNDPGSFVNVSPIHIRGIVRNLLDNALKFTKEGGSIEFSIGIKDSSLVIVVQDSGIGISEEEQKKLFTKFHRGTSTIQYDYEGTGIGLYLTKLIVEAHHGTIEVFSEIGKGSIFTVTIPQSVVPDKPDIHETTPEDPEPPDTQDS